MNWDTKWPDLAGKFSGTVMHAFQYKEPSILKGKRVLVVGVGPSGGPHFPRFMFVLNLAIPHVPLCGKG